MPTHSLDDQQCLKQITLGQWPGVYFIANVPQVALYEWLAYLDTNDEVHRHQERVMILSARM